MSRRPDLYITVKGSRLLLRGLEADRCCRAIACSSPSDPESCRHDGDYLSACVPRWSDAGRGFVLPAVHMQDALAWAQAGYLLAVVTDLDRDKAAS